MGVAGMPRQLPNLGRVRRRRAWVWNWGLGTGTGSGTGPGHSLNSGRVHTQNPKPQSPKQQQKKKKSKRYPKGKKTKKKCDRLQIQNCRNLRSFFVAPSRSICLPISLPQCVQMQIQSPKKPKGSTRYKDTDTKIQHPLRAHSHSHFIFIDVGHGRAIGRVSKCVGHSRKLLPHFYMPHYSPQIPPFVRSKYAGKGPLYKTWTWPSSFCFRGFTSTASLDSFICHCGASRAGPNKQPANKQKTS